MFWGNENLVNLGRENKQLDCSRITIDVKWNYLDADRLWEENTEHSKQKSPKMTFCCDKGEIDSVPRWALILGQY